MKFFGIFSIVFFSCFGGVDLAAQASPCQSIDHQAFDFWIGEWEVRLPNGQLAGHNSIRKIHGNCVVEENWTGVGVSRGSSVNHFDPNTKKWKQKWLDNSGLNLEFIGEIKDDALTTFAETISPKTGDVVFNRMTIAKIDENNVSQIWEQSSNKESWQPVFEGHYKRMTHTVNSKLAFAVYDTFSIAYQELKPEIVANLYRPDAIYISGKQDATRGRAAILESFTSFFSSIKESNRTMDIEFKIVSREESDEVIADVGYYKLTYKQADGSQKENAGKFSTVMVRDALNNWQFSSDVYHPATLKEFEAAISLR